MLAWLAMVALAEPPPELGVVWGLSVDGAPVGTRELRVRYEGETGARMRMVESWTELAGGKRKEAYTFRQRVTANAPENGPAAFLATSERDGATSEVQARVEGGVWKLFVTGADGEQQHTLRPSAVDLSTVDLFDPEAQRRIGQFERVRLLSVDEGRVLEGEVVPLGPSDVVVGGEALWTEGFELRTVEGAWRFWYASNGFLVRWEAPIGGRQVEAVMLGAAPRAIDEFQVPGLPAIEELPLP